MGADAERILQALVNGQVTMCQSPGCGHTFPPGEGKSNRRYCGQPDCTRGRGVTAKHRSRAIVEMRALAQKAKQPPVMVLQTQLREVVKVLKADSNADEEEIREAAVRLGAAAVNIAATVEALGRAGLTSPGAARPALPSGDSPSDARALPASTSTSAEAGRAALEAAS